MQEPTILNWAYWAFFGWAIMTTLEPWGKVDPAQLPMAQRFLSFCLALFALPFWFWMLWHVFQLFGGWYAAKAFFASWLGMLALSVALFGTFGLIVSTMVKEPSERGPYLAAFRYGFFTPKLALAFVASYLLFKAYS